MRDKGGGQIFHLVVHSPPGHNSQNLAKLKPARSWELHPALPHGWQGVKHLYHLPLPSQVHEQGAG